MYAQSKVKKKSGSRCPRRTHLIEVELVDVGVVERLVGQSRDVPDVAVLAAGRRQALGRVSQLLAQLRTVHGGVASGDSGGNPTSDGRGRPSATRAQASVGPAAGRRAAPWRSAVPQRSGLAAQ